MYGMQSKRMARVLTTAVMAWLTASPFSASAYDTQYIYQDGRPLVEMNFLHQNEGLGNAPDYLINPGLYNLPTNLVDATISATSYWTGILGPRAKNPVPWQVFVTTEDDQNAGAMTYSLSSDGKKISVIKENYVQEAINKGRSLNELTAELAKKDTIPAGQYAYSEISIGNNMGAERKGAVRGWWVETDSVLPTNEQATDFVGTFRHELGHALGIDGKFAGQGDKTDRGEPIVWFDPAVTSKDSWNLHLVDQNQNPAKTSMIIVSRAGFAELKKDNPTIKEKDFFIVDNPYLDKDLVGAQGYAYFVGPHVTEALGDATFNGVKGLPVNAWERSVDKSGKVIIKFEGSHLQTAGMMSHRSYSNYTSFMEAELAVMQDLGYNFDRKAFFGRSIYSDGGTIRNTQGYSARNEAGTAYLENTYSAVPLGIGLHIYGSRNKVTQAADILTHGTGATGVRIDGIENRLDIPVDTEIHADGRNGNGLLVAYGRNHKITQNGTVTAMGKDGDGVCFDFGSSSNGAVDEYRGSYIRFKRTVNTQGKIEESENMPLTKMDKFTYNSAADELNGPMVDSYDLYGKLAGGANAIYIGRNALVKNINIHEGATLKGNITSEWTHFNTDGSYDAPNNDLDSLAIQYGGKSYSYDTYHPDLITNLNFQGDMAYSGNINGEDNIKMRVQGGELHYGGTANVINVTVDKDAALLGGSYTVNDMTDEMAEGISDDTTGKVINHGLLGADGPDKTLAIEGDLVSDGKLQAYGGGKAGHIAVTGDADINGSIVTATNMLPGDTKTVLTAEDITGSIKNPEGKPYAISGMLSATGELDDDSLKVTTVAANNLAATDQTVNDTYTAMVHMDEHLRDTGDTRRDAMHALFTLEAEDATKALKSLSANPAAQSMSLAQQNTVTSHIISSRLTEAFAQKNVTVKVPAMQLADGEEAKPMELSAKLPQPADNDFWFKAAKNWGDLRGGANYHGTTLALGWDRAYGQMWRGGAFASYGTVGFADTGASNRLKDTRLGLYGGYKHGPHAGYVYLDYGWLKNDLRRGLAGLDLTAEADYDSRILELGGEYKYDLDAFKNTPWHISPYGNVQLSRLWQDGYRERGAGVYGQRVASAANTYFALGLGVEFKRYLPKGSYALRLGVKHALAGADPRLRFGYVGNDAESYEMRNEQDKTHFVLSINGESEFAPGWTMAGEAGLQKGAHAKDVMCAFTLKRMW